MRRLLPLILFIILSLGFAIGLSKDPRALPSQMIDKPFPEFILSDLFEPEKQYSKVDLENEISLVNVFGSWCISCVQEHRMLMELSQNKTVKLIGINWRDTRPAAERWLTRYQNPYSKIIFDEESQLAIDLGVTGAPESFLVDRSGYIRYKHVGIITPEVWNNILLPVVQDINNDINSPS